MSNYIDSTVELEAERIEGLVRESLNLNVVNHQAEDKPNKDSSVRPSSPQSHVSGEDAALSPPGPVSTREYLSKVLPCVKSGLLEIARERPDNPLKHLSEFLAREAETRQSQ